jgi:hypothetical protein
MMGTQHQAAPRLNRKEFGNLIRKSASSSSSLRITMMMLTRRRWTDKRGRLNRNRKWMRRLSNLILASRWNLRSN